MLKLQNIKKINSLIFSLSLIAVVSISCVNKAKVQVLAGTKDITYGRLNEIVDKIIGGLSSKDNIYSNDLDALLKEYENPKLQGNGDKLSLPGELFLGDDLIAMGIGGEEMTKEAKRQFKTISCTDNDAVVQVSLDQDFGDFGRLQDEVRLILVKEKGIWNLDDVSFLIGNEWSPHKKWLRYNIIKSISMYQGHMLDESDPRPFKMCVMIYRYPNESGNTPVWGAFKFDNKEDDDWCLVDDGSIEDGNIFIMVNENGTGNHSFSWNAASDGKEIRGKWQAYSPLGQIIIDREFVMSLIP